MSIGAGLGAGRLAEAGLLAAALLLATRELDRAPLEYHEAYVVETAREMGDRGDWIVPWFNGEPRLTKPPLSYWLTALGARASGSDGVRPWHGRLPSALAGVGLVALVLWLGMRLYDRRTSLLAGTMMASSYAFFHYGHSARADLLYAFWCGLALAAFVEVWSAVRASRRSRWAPLVLWSALAAATLTKGPQVPAMLGIATLVWAKVERGAGWPVVRALRPAAGLALYVLLAAPWWIALRVRLGGEALAGSQLSGSLLRPGWPAIDYLYRLPHLLLPWALLLPALAAVEWRGAEGRAARWLAIVAVVPLVLFSLGSQQRTFYALPVVAPILLLLAEGIRRALARSADRDRLRGWIRRVGMGFALLFSLALGAWLAGAARLPMPPPDGWGAPLLLAVSLALAAGMLWADRRWVPGDLRGIYGLAFLAFAGFWTLGVPGQEWSKGRPMAERLGRVAAGEAAGGTVWTYGFSPDPYVYYAGPPVRELSTAESLAATLARSAGGLVVIAVEARLVDLPPGAEVHPVVRAGVRDGGRSLVARIRSPGPTAGVGEPRPARVLD